VIEMEPGASRGKRLVDEGSSEHTGIPLIGKVASEEPNQAKEHIETH
ncbi:repressor LexA, partial [Pseudoalteromonas phenolica]